MNFIGDDEPQRLSALSVTSNFFDVLMARARFGRVFHDADLPRDTDNEIVLTYGFWQRQFGGDSGVVGRPLKLTAGSRTVIGVLPKDFDFEGRSLDAIAVLSPASISNVQSHAQHTLSAVGRLRPGVSLSAAQQDLSAVAAHVADVNAEIAGWSGNAFSMRDELVRDVRGPLVVLFDAAGLVLLIGCINVANLLLTRGVVREREVALRQALGASRARVVGQLVIESGELAIGGGVLGLVLASLTLNVMLRVAPPGLLPTDIGLDLRVLGFALALTVVTTLIVGLWPALRATSPRLGRALRDGGRASWQGGMRALVVRRALVVAETSLALVLLICAGLVLQNLRHMLAVDPGFRADHVATMRVTLPGPRYNDTTQVQFFRDLQSRLEGRGGIESVAAANTPPITGGGLVPAIRLIGEPARPHERRMGAATGVTPGYFRTMGIRMLQGRDMAWSDAVPNLLVSEAAARQFWPAQSPLGKRIGFGPSDTLGLEVIGVVGDTHSRGLATDALPMIYIATSGVTRVARTMSIVVRGRGDLASMLATTRQAVHEIDRTLPLFNAQSVSSLVEESVGQPRLNTTLLSYFAGVAAVLAVIGIYGVVSYSVTQRTQEIGVRMALGARRSDVMRLILREGAALAAVGVILGIAGAYAATPLIGSWLFGIERTDVTTMAGTAVLLIASSLAASYLPARRAARVDPLIAMRAD